MKRFSLLSVVSCMLAFAGFAQNNAKHNDGGFNSAQHFAAVQEQHNLVRKFLGADAFSKIAKEAMKQANVAEKDKQAFAKMLREKFNLKDRHVIIAKINAGELTRSNIENYLNTLKPQEYASYYQGAFLKGKGSLLENAPQVKLADDKEMENWLSSKLHAPVTMSSGCGNNIDFDLGNYSGWTGNYTTSNCTSPTPNTRNVAGINFTGMNVTTDQHGLCNSGNDPSVISGTLPCVSPFSGAPVSARLGDVLDGCGAADMTFNFTVNANNTNFTYSYAVILYDGHPATDAPKVQITMKDLTTGLPLTCAAYTIDATQGAGGANGYLPADPNNTLLYYKPWSQVYIPLLNYMGHTVQVTVVSSDCNGGAHRGYCYIDFTCSPLQLLSTTPMVCNGSTAVLTAPPGAASYSWSVVGGSGNITSGTTSQTVAVNQAGHYQVTLGSFGSGCTMVIDTIIPGGPTAPIASFTDNPGCYSAPVSFTDQSNPNGGSSITSWTYTFGDGGTSNSQNPNHTYAAPGTYTVQLTIDNGCLNTYTSTVTVSPGVTPSFTANTPCLGSATNFNNTTAGATSYTWTLGNGTTSNSASPSVTYTASGSYVVTLSVSTGAGCTGTLTQTVVVNPMPTVTATSNTICNGAGPVNITGGGASTYTWNTGATTATISQNPATTTNYTVIGTDVNGCVGTATTSISVISNPTVAITPATICAGSTGTLVVNGASTYNWSGPSITSATTGSVITANPATTSTYTVIGSIGTCTATTTGVLTVNPMPVPAFVASTECQGTATTFTNNSTPAGSTFDWSFGDGNTALNTASPTNTYSAAGTYVVTLTVTATGGCVATTSANVTVKPIPTLSPIANIGVCEQGQIAVPAFVSNPSGATVGWSNTNATIGLPANGVGNIPPFTGTTGGATTSVQGVVTAIPTLNGCVGPPINFTLSVAPQPSVTLTSPPITCPGQQVPSPTYTMNPNDPNMTFGWTNSNTATGQLANGIGIPGAFTASSNATLANISGVVTVTPSLNGCQGPPSTYTVTIYPTPVINPIANVEYCPGVATQAINFSVLPGGGSPSFTWFNSNTGIGLAGNGNGSPLPSFNTINGGNTAQMGTISVSASLNGCPAVPVPFNITVNPNPVAAFSNSHLVCVGSPMSFTDMSSVGTGFIAGWAWNLDGSASSFSTSQNPQYVIQPAGTHSVTLTATTDKGCTASVTQPVYINYIPVASFTGGGQGCPILTVNNFADASSVTGPAQVASWSWSFGNGATSNSQTPGILTYGNPSPVQNAIYNVSLTVSSDSGCVSTAYSNPAVTVYPHPLPGFTWGPQDPAPDVLNPTIFFFNQSQGANGQNGITYYLGDVFLNNNAANYTNVPDPVHTYQNYDPYTYYVTQWVQNSYGCKDSITKPVEIIPSWTFYIPNAFSPNGDGVNEGFKGTGIGIDNTTYNLWVFDRWGNQVFYSDDMEKVWDGRVQGKKDGDIVQEDVYVWKVKFQDFLGKKHEYKGTVSVIK